MSGCLYCGKETEVSQRGFPKKYCSDICASRYRNWKKTGKRIDPNYVTGSKTKEREARLKETRKRYQWYCENKLRTYQVAEMLGINEATVWGRFKSIGLKSTIVRTGQKNVREHAFWNLEDVDKIRYEAEPIPEGYLSPDDAAAHLGYATITFKKLDKKGLPFIEKKNDKNRIIHCYAVSDLDEWNRKRLEKKKVIKAKKKKISKQERERRGKEIQERLRKKAQEKLAAYQKEIDENNAKWVSEKDVCQLLGLKGINHHISKGKLDIKATMSYGRRWFDPKQVHELKIHLEQLRSRDPHVKVYTRKDDYTSVEAYENKLFNVKIPKLMQDDRFISKRTGLHLDSFLDCVALNKKWHKNRTQYDMVKMLDCRTCGKNLPYTSFRFAPTGRGRKKDCKACVALIHKNRYNPELQKQKRIDNYISKFRTLIGIQIKRDLSLQSKKYREDVGITQIWSYIEQHLGYNAEDLCNHLEDQFEDWMSWSNHGRGNHGQFWQIDHIIPRCDLQFGSLREPNFKKCWALENMRPLCQHKNKKRYYDSN
jgi:hypothetical protein